MEFDWDAGNWPKCGGHGMTKEEIEFVLEFAAAVIPDAHAHEERLNAIGYTAGGRIAFVAFTMRDEKVRPISARYMHKEESDRYV